MTTDASRREFFRACGRYLALGGLGVLGGALAVQRRVEAPGRQTCSGGGVCRGCPVLPDCGLPTALSMKLKTSGHDGTWPSGNGGTRSVASAGVGPWTGRPPIRN